MPVLHHQLICVLHQARRLLFTRLVEALLVQLDVQASSQEDGTIVQDRRIAVRGLPDGAQISVEARASQARPVQILGSSDKSPGFSQNSRPQRNEIPAGLGSQKE